MNVLNRGSSTKVFRERIVFLYWLIFLSFFAIILRLGYLQLFKGDIFLEYSIENRIRSDTVHAPRGMIYDRDARILVDNMPSFDVTLTPQYITREKLDFILKEVSQILGISEKDIKQKLQRAVKQPKFLPVSIKEDVSRDELARVEVNKLRIPGLDVKVVIRRTYLNQNMMAHLLGYIGEISSRELKFARERFGRDYRQGDIVGKSGLELFLEKELRGEDGVNFFEVDAMGRKQSRAEKSLFAPINDIKPVAGNNLILTIDLDLQGAAEESFKEDQAGAAAAMNLKTGEMLVMTSMPSFDPTLFSRGIAATEYKRLLDDPLKPLRNKLIQDHYPPGSVYKVVVAIAGMMEGVINKNTRVNCPGWFRLGRRSYRCWRRHGHGVMDIHSAIVESCDTFFWWVANKLDVDIIAKYARMFGLGTLTGLSLPEEKTGLVPTSNWKLESLKEAWIRGETLSVAIGQGYNLTTPIQLLKLYSIIANKGIEYRPFFVKRIEDPEGKILQVNEPNIERTLTIEPELYDIVNEGLFGVLHEPKGTAKWSKIFGIDMAGKTGTSQVVKLDQIPQKCEEQPYRFRDHAFFVGFAPVDDPEIVAVAIVEHGCSGSSSAAPIVRNIIHAYYKKYKDWKKPVPTERQRKGIIRDTTPKKEPEKVTQDLVSDEQGLSE